MTNNKKNNNYNSAEMLVALENPGYKKANVLISGKYKASLLENKILALSMSRAYKEGSRAVARITTEELKILLGKGSKVSGSFYTRLKEAANELAGRKVFIEDKDHQIFTVFNLVGSATYRGNELIIKFEPDLTDYLIHIKSNYTYLNIPILMSFNNIYSYRLYELLKSKAYNKDNNKTQEKEFVTSYSVSELKITLGAIDTTPENVSSALKKTSPDFDEIVNEISEDKTFSRWSDFRKVVIDKAVNEINEKSDLNVRYSLIKSGLGGKVTKIVFYFKYKENYFKINKSNLIKNNEIIKSNEPEDIVDLIVEIQEYIDEPIKTNDIINILKVANYETEKIKKAYDIACEQEEIKNLVGWMIAAIKDDFKKVENIHKIKGNSYEKTKQIDEFIEELHKFNHN